MVWKPIKGQEAIAGRGAGLARRILASGGEGLDATPPRLPDDRVLAPAAALRAEDLAVERIATLELRVDRLEDAIAAFRIRSEAPVNEVTGKTSFPGFPRVSPEPDDVELGAFGEADRRARWRAANLEKIRERDRARKAKQRAEAGK